MQHDYNFTLGELVYAIRKINKLTQVEYSKRLGVVQSTISKVEKDIFEDVPFSLISKISTDFKIPLSHFQIGHLPIRKSISLHKTIPKEYLADGVFKAKTVFYLLLELSKLSEKNIYKEIKLPYQLMCLSNLTYSFEFINKLYSLTQENLIKAIDSIQVTGTQEVTTENLKRYIAGIHGIILTKDIPEIGNGRFFTLKFSSDLHELDTIYAKLLSLELKLIFETGFEIEPSKVQGEYRVTPIAIST